MMLAPSTRRSAGEGNCPVCGSRVQVVGDPVEGTMHYEPVVTDEMVEWMAARQRLGARLASRIVVVEGCWQWTGHCRVDGYAKVLWKGRHVYIHRLVYELLVGPIPTGLHIDHLCRNRSCCNPQHLEAVTPQVNASRKPVPTHCPQGHAFSHENTYVRPEGWRECRICAKEARRRYRDGATA